MPAPMKGIRIIDEATIRRSAEILGPGSSSAKALADFEGRLARGEEPVFARQGETLLVVNLASKEA